MIIHSILPSSESRRKLLLLPEMSCYYQRCPDCHPVHILTVILSIFWLSSWAQRRI